MDQVEQFNARLEELLKEFGFNLGAGDMGSEINLENSTHVLGYWEGSIPGRFVKW